VPDDKAQLYSAAAELNDNACNMITGPVNDSAEAAITIVKAVFQNETTSAMTEAIGLIEEGMNEAQNARAKLAEAASQLEDIADRLGQ
jgi:hypothetical protein